MKWSDQYLGVTHCGDISDFRRATVVDWGTFAILEMWWKGCGFSPREQTFSTAEEAMAAGEKWIKNELG